MKNTEDVHRTTEAVYKNLVDNFNNGMYHILLTGKAYYKALQGVAATAHAYNDALGRVGSAAKLCKGGTDEIGEAVLQIAEAQKEIQKQLEESTKSLFKELLLPLEMKLDKEFKKASSDHRKYMQGHKATLTPYNKAFDSLKKFRKKTKNKFVYDNEKEAQYVNTLARCQRKLDEYRLNGLRIALLEERKCHCYLLQRLCATSTRSAVGHNHAADMYAPLPEWRHVCADPNTLPRAAEELLSLDESYEQMNGGPYHHSQSAVLHRDTQSLGSPFRRSASVHDIYRQSGHFDGTNTMPPRTAPPLPPSSAPQTKAIYSFTASVESQLSFMEGDMIAILGEKSEGWQYGQNTRTNRYGWFPLSFTQPISTGMPPSPEFKALGASQRYKSVGDLLDSRSLSENSFMEHDIPGNIRRPKSLYDGPSFDNAVCTAAPISTIYQGHAPVPPNTPYAPHPQYAPAPSPPSPDQKYQPMPMHTSDIQLQYSGRGGQSLHQSGIFSSQGRPVHDGSTALPSPPLPPPPPPVPTPTQHQLSPRHTTHVTPTHTHARTSTHPPNVRGVTPSSVPYPPSFPAPPPPPHVTSHHTFSPPPPPPPTNYTPPSVVSPMLLVSQPQQVAPGSGVPSTASSGYGSPVRQQPSQPPPPPPAIGARHLPKEDYGMDEDLSFEQNPMFSSVSLRRTKTNDRSAPRIN